MRRQHEFGALREFAREHDFLLIAARQISENVRRTARLDVKGADRLAAAGTSTLFSQQSSIDEGRIPQVGQQPIRSRAKRPAPRRSGRDPRAPIQTPKSRPLWQKHMEFASLQPADPIIPIK